MGASISATSGGDAPSVQELGALCKKLVEDPVDPEAKHVWSPLLKAFVAAEDPTEWCNFCPHL